MPYRSILTMFILNYIVPIWLPSILPALVMCTLVFTFVVLLLTFIYIFLLLSFQDSWRDFTDIMNYFQIYFFKVFSPPFLLMCNTNFLLILLICTLNLLWIHPAWILIKAVFPFVVTFLSIHHFSFLTSGKIAVTL